MGNQRKVYSISFYLIILFVFHLQPELLFLKNQEIIKWGGTAIIAVMVYIETATLIGLIVPGGETLLFTAGLLCGTDTLSISLAALIGVLIGASLLGDITGYYVGAKLGKKLHKKEDTWYFKRKYLERAENFYKDKGKWSLVLGRFLPIIRTFNPAFSGSIKMPKGKFILYIGIGAIFFTGVVVSAGYYLGKQFPWIKEYLGWILLGIVILVLIPFFKKIFFQNETSSSDS